MALSWLQAFPSPEESPRATAQQEVMVMMVMMLMVIMLMVTMVVTLTTQLVPLEQRWSRDTRLDQHSGGGMGGKSGWAGHDGRMILLSRSLREPSWRPGRQEQAKETKMTV